MLDEHGCAECPLVESHFDVRHVPAPRVHPDINHFWGIGARLGPQESGAATNYRTPVRGAPAAMRETSLRELMVSQEAQGRIGFPRL